MSDSLINSDFETPSREDWMAMVEAGLRGAQFESLCEKTQDNLIRGPLKTASDRPENISSLPRESTPLLAGRPWHICSPIRDPDIPFANKQLLDDLKGGASALDITLGKGAIVLKQTSDLKRLLEGVHLDLVPLRFSFTQITADEITKIIERVTTAEILQNCDVNLGYDPIVQSYFNKNFSDPITPETLQNLPNSFTPFCVNAAIIHDFGGTEAQELSFMAASAAYYWREYGANIQLSIRLAANQDTHLGIAKIRAARRILNRIAEAFGNKAGFTIHGVTALRMMQTIDPWTNLLRVMTAGVSAICGGAEYITLRPFTDAKSDAPRLATPFGYRIARNMQLMMMEESHLGQVKDAAYGSYFHENMTNAIAQTAWTEFQAIESGGGIVELLTSGIFQQAVDKAKGEREAENHPILGVTLHPADNIQPAKLRGAQS